MAQLLLWCLWPGLLLLLRWWSDGLLLLLLLWGCLRRPQLLWWLHVGQVCWQASVACWGCN
jgi:hypothetical protein